jgi:hypothetical protein
MEPPHRDDRPPHGTDRQGRVLLVPGAQHGAELGDVDLGDVG